MHNEISSYENNSKDVKKIIQMNGLNQNNFYLLKG